MALKLNIDSDATGLFLAEEASVGVLPAAASTIFREMEPNSYQSFGGQVGLTPRSPIVEDRQRLAGVVTSVDAAMGINNDLTSRNMTEILQGFLYASIRQKNPLVPTTTATDEYTVAAGGGAYVAGDLVLARDFAQSANNGLKTVASSTATDVTVNETLVASDTSGGTIRRCGFQFGSGEVEIVVSGTYPVLNRASGSKNFTDFGLVPGEWIRIGGDNAATQFAGAGNNGFARVRSVTASVITFDKTQGTMTVDAGGSKTIRVFFGTLLKNEQPASIVTRTYHGELRMGSNDDSDETAKQAAYVKGAYPNSASFNIQTGQNVTVDLEYVGVDVEDIDENDAGTIKSEVADVTVVAAAQADAYNGSNDAAYLNLQTVTSAASNPTPLFAHVENVTISIANNVTIEQAVGSQVGFVGTRGEFAVSLSLTAYLVDIGVFGSVRSGVTCSFDMHLARDNAGISFDIPVIKLADARPNIAKGASVRVPLTGEAGKGTRDSSAYDHTLVMMFWDYLPDAAMPAA